MNTLTKNSQILLEAIKRAGGRYTVLQARKNLNINSPYQNFKELVDKGVVVKEKVYSENGYYKVFILKKAFWFAGEKQKMEA